MGNSWSSGEGTSGSRAPTAAKTCYYELLAVDRNASQEEIKKAYKKKALELHPDRNYNDVERATKLFAEVQAAYEVLSDPQERAWYDSHRDAILYGDSHSFKDSGPDSSSYTTTTTSAEVLSWFTLFPSKSKIDYSDGPQSFYTILSNTFSRLAQEEVDACLELGLEEPYLPSFGGSKSGYKDHVRGFYQHWMGFKTYKDFAWEDLYRLSNAPDRRIRRAMDKENRRLREEGKREYEDNIREFVKFVRKRDPRYSPPTPQSEAERQATVLARSKEQAARARAANAVKQTEYQAADWMQATHDEYRNIEGEYTDPDGSEEDGAEERVKTVYECVACKKMFKTEGQSKAHEKSKKHQQAVWRLKKEMRKENRGLGLTPDSEGEEEIVEPEVEDVGHDIEEKNSTLKDDMPINEREKKRSPLPKPKVEIDDDEGGEEKGTAEENGTQEESDQRETRPSGFAVLAEPNDDDDNDEGEDLEEEEEEDSDHAPLSTVHPHISRNRSPTPPSRANSPTSPVCYLDLESEFVSISLNDPTIITVSDEQKKLGAAKARREKKKMKATVAAAAGSAGEDGHKCVSCGNVFASKTKIFQHLKENPGHTVPVKKGAGVGAGGGGPGGGGGGGGGGGKKGKGKRK